VRLSLGGAATRAASVIALLLLFLFMFTWARSATRLIYALARDGLFPRALARVDAASGAPRLAALALAAAWGVALVAQVALSISVEAYIQLSSANFLLTYVLIIVTGWRLLRGARWVPALIVSSLAVLLLVVAGYQSLWYAAATAAVFALAMVARRAYSSRRPTRDATTYADAA
jgi:amino acid efflux transporter